MIRRVSFDRRRQWLVDRLYAGKPCLTCGIRLSEHDSKMSMADHLDWHYRRNRRLKDPRSSSASHRHIYPTLEEWIGGADRDDEADLHPKKKEGERNRRSWRKKEEEEKQRVVVTGRIGEDVSSLLPPLLGVFFYF